MSHGTTNIGGKFYISTTAQNGDLDEAGFQALSYTQVPNMGTMGDTGITQNAVNYSTWDKQVVQKGKGEANAGDPTVEFLDKPNAGLDAMDAAAVVTNSNNYAYKIEWEDGSVEYNRGLCMGPSRPKGANEDFKRVVYTLGLQQAPVITEATSSA